MMHPVLMAVGSLSMASTGRLEECVDILVAESDAEQALGETSMQAGRAEALALLAHELRRREVNNVS